MSVSADLPQEFIDSVRGVVVQERANQADGRLGGQQPGRFWVLAADLGWTRILAGDDADPAEGVMYGGAIAEAIGAAAIQTPFFTTAVDAAILMSRCASASQRSRYLDPALDGRCVLPVALYEAAGDDSLRGPRTTCRQSGGEYRLNGTKLLVPYAQWAPAILCTATVQAEGPGAVACFVVPADAQGLSIEPVRTATGAPMSAISFNEVRVAGDDRLSGGSVLAALDEMLSVGGALNCAHLYGIGRAALELTLAFTSDRHQFGKPIGSFQAVQHHLVDMYQLLEQTRVLTLQALVAVAERGRFAVREVALAKIKAGEGVPSLLRMAHQIHGGVGYYVDYPLAGLYNASIAAEAMYGAAIWHRQRLGDLVAADSSTLLPADAHGRRSGAVPKPIR